MTWWFWDAVFLLSSLSYLQQQWTKAASRGPWGASLALGPGTNPVLDIADFKDRSALACLSAGCCLSPLCTDREEVHPLVDWVCLSVKSDTPIDRNRLFWIYALSGTLVSGSGCVCMFCSCILSLLSLRWWITYHTVWTSRGNHCNKHPLPPGFLFRLKTLMLQLFLSLYTMCELFILWHIGNIKAHVTVLFHCYLLTQWSLFEFWSCLICGMFALADSLKLTFSQFVPTWEMQASAYVFVHVCRCPLYVCAPLQPCPMSVPLKPLMGKCQGKGWEQQ